MLKIKYIAATVLNILIAFFVAFPCQCAAEAGAAEDFEKTYTVAADGLYEPWIVDDNIYTYKKIKKAEIISSVPLFGIYIKYDRMPSSFTVTADGVVLPEESCEYLHQYMQLSGAKNVVIEYSEETSVADVFAFSEKEPPDFVQRWETLDRADIMICPTHSDDDQLYFAGMIPWCSAKGNKVQVVYFTNHWNTHDRPHELLDGLWHCSDKYYPVISEFPDLYAENPEQARLLYASCGFEEKDFIDFYLDLFGHLKPMVVVGHDINGEYGHGVHCLNSEIVRKAVCVSAEKGIWDVPKTYMHLWDKNKTVFDWDAPMDEFQGKSAFNISQEAFGFHKSQHVFQSLLNWLNGTDSMPVTKASQITRYSPCDFGLYRTTVGTDAAENGLFDNVATYTDRE